jgi:hypothetical protein
MNFDTFILLHLIVKCVLEIYAYIITILVIMKKIILCLGFVGLIAGSKAQITIENHSAGDVIGIVSGDTLVRLNTGDEIITEIHAIASGNGSYLLRREKLVSVGTAAWTEYICWGPSAGVGGGCYNASGQTWISPVGDAVNLTASVYGAGTMHINPNGTSGNCHYRYYISTVAGVLVDSVDVKLTSTAGIKENKSVTLSVYPNPASEYLTVASTATGEMNVRITDVLGKEVFEDRFSGSKKIDLDNFKNGVFIVSITNNEGFAQTRRIVVRK